MDPNSSSGLPPVNPVDQELPKFIIEAEGDLLGGIKPLPDFYGENRLVTMARDPVWFYAYWDATPDRFDDVRAQVGDETWQKGKAILRVYDVTGLDGDPGRAHRWFDVPISFDPRRWYVNVPETGRSWITELGFVFPDGRFIALLRSNLIHLPRGGVSSETDSRWMIVNVSEWFKLLEVMGPSSRRSAEADRLSAQRWEFVRSVFSGSSSRLSGSPLPIPPEEELKR